MVEHDPYMVGMGVQFSLGPPGGSNPSVSTEINS